MIAKTVNNGIIYPTDIYRKYNIYLMESLEKLISILNPTFSPKDSLVLKKMNDLLLENSEDENNEKNISHLLNVVDWEEKLVVYYDSLKIIYDHNNNSPKPIDMDKPLSINNFFRKEKLKKMNNLNNIKLLKRKLLKNKK